MKGLTECIRAPNYARRILWSIYQLRVEVEVEKYRRAAAMVLKVLRC